MVDKKNVAIGSLLTILLSLSAVQISELSTNDYQICNEGRTYGEWLNVNNTPYLYQCDITEEIKLCSDTTKTRCYLFNETKLTELYSQTLNNNIETEFVYQKANDGDDIKREVKNNYLTEFCYYNNQKNLCSEFNLK